jgi:GntR family transcriptional regulator
MKIWLSKNSEVSVRAQLVAQMSLGIVSQDLKRGEKLPSTREMARRFKVHPNTVNAAYRELAETGWVEFRAGSGVYVLENAPDKIETPLKLDVLISRFVNEAQALGFTPSEIQARLKMWCQIDKPAGFLVVESDINLQRILIEEIRSLTGFPTTGISLEDFQKAETNFQPAAMFDEAPKINRLLSPPQTCIFLKANSVSNSIKNEIRPPEDALIAVVSDWEKFLVWAKTILVAAEIQSDRLILRSTAGANWRSGLQSASIIICDSVTAKEFEDDSRVRIFRVISDKSLEELKNSLN